jgi:voltage-dependent calcium channel
VNTDYTIEETQDAAAETQARKAEFIAMHPTYDKTLWIFSEKSAVRRFFQKMVTPSNGERIFGTPPTFLAQAAFQSFILFAVIGGIIVAAIASPVYRYQHRLDNPGKRFQWHEISEAAFGFTLFVEFVIKVIADGFIFTPNAYVYSIWNLVDFVILWALLGNVIPTLIYHGNISRVGRVLKAFRVLRLITMFGFMRNTFYSIIFAGAARILDAAILAILYMIPYAVWGLNVFNGLMFSCNDPNSTGKADCFNEYISTPIDTNNSNLGFLAPRAWSNPKVSTRWSFDTFPSSLLILFEIVSEEGWIDVLLASMSITSRDQQPLPDASQANGVFFVVYNLLGGVVILTLFVRYV